VVGRLLSRASIEVDDLEEIVGTRVAAVPAFLMRLFGLRLLARASAIALCRVRRWTIAPAGERMGRPEKMARNKFPDPPLSEAEERVVRAVQGGTVADCSALVENNDPAKADGSPEAPDEKWPDTRNVRADLIRWL
jgi:hypothetical protein